MTFLKNNWLKLTVSVIALVGVIVSIVLLSNGMVKDASLGDYTDKMAYSSLFMLIAQTIFFLGIFAYLIMSMFGATSKIATYILLGMAAVALIFVILSIGFGSSYISYAQEQIDAGYRTAEALPSGIQIPAIGNLTKEQLIASLDYSQFSLTSGIIAKVVSLIIYSLLPIAYSVNKVFKKSDNN